MGLFKKKTQAEKDAKAKRKLDKKQAKWDYKLSKKDVRLQKTLSRQNTKAIAYQSGIDPNAWIGESIKGVANAGAIALNPKARISQDGNTFTGDQSSMFSGNMIYIILGIVVLMLYMNKK